MKEIKVLFVICLIVLVASCGGAGSNSPGGVQFYISQIDSDSYLPLTPGIKTTFPDTVIYEAEDGPTKVSIEGMTVSVLEGGIIKIEGKWIVVDGNGDETTRDIIEELKLAEEGDSVVLLESSTDVVYSNGETFSNRRMYDPAVTILEDKYDLTNKSENTYEVYTTENLNVYYEGDSEELTNNLENEVYEIRGYEDISAYVQIGEKQSFQINGSEVEAYRVTFTNDLWNSTIWYSGMNISGGYFYFAKGVGIVKVSGVAASETNAIEEEVDE